MTTARIQIGGLSVPINTSASEGNAGGLSAPIGEGLFSAPGPGGPATQPAVPAQPGDETSDETPGAGSWWVITRGQYDDRANLAIFCGTQVQVDALVVQLNQPRRYVDPYDLEQVVTYRGDAYDAKQIAPITAAADLAPGEGAGQ